MKVVVFIRKKRPEANSIEEIFYSLKKYLGDNVALIELPYSGASVSSIFKNILFAKKHRGEVNHISGEVHYIALGLGKRTLLTIHDVQSIVKGNFLARFLKKWIWFKLPLSIVNKVSVISHFTKDELTIMVPKVKRKISVIYNPISTHYIQTLVKRHNNFPNKILHIGTKPNKNLEGVLKAIEGLQLKLTIVGYMSDNQKQLAQELHIHYENYYNISYDKILELYASSSIVTFPSFYEGFGMPIIEANAAGVPIIASDIPVLHEVAGDAAYFVNPKSIEDIRNAIIRLLTDETLRTNLIRLGKQNIERFTPQTVAEQYKTLYNQIYNT